MCASKGAKKLALFGVAFGDFLGLGDLALALGEGNALFLGAGAALGVTFFLKMFLKIFRKPFGSSPTVGAPPK